MKRRRQEAGFAVIVVVLLTAVMLVGVLTVTTTLALGQRTSSANEYAAYRAVLVSESGHDALYAHTRNVPFGGGMPASCASGSAEQRQTCALNSYLSTLPPVNVGGGTSTLRVASVTLDAEGNLASADLESTSAVGQDGARVLRTYPLRRDSLGFPKVPAAITSYPGVDLGGNATVSGANSTDVSNTGLLENFAQVQGASVDGLLYPGLPVTVTLSAQDQTKAGQFRPGQYVQLPTVALAGGGSTGQATFRVASVVGDKLNLEVVSTPPVSRLAPGSPRLGNVLNGLVSSQGNQLTVSSVETFYPGDSISATVAGTTYTTKVQSVSGNVITTTGWPSGTPPLPQGLPLRKSTNAIVTAGTYDGNNKQTGDQGGILQGATGSALLASPINNALFEQTMGVSPAKLKGMASVVPEASFTGEVNGLVWVDTDSDQRANLNNEKVRGSGVLVIDGDLVLNNNGSGSCDFSGLLIVRGNLRMQGNIEICGALLVEGAVVTQDGTNVTGLDGDETNVSGTGRKVRYDVGAIMNAIRGVGPYTFEAATNWRQR